jgi:hypothetical protein
MAGFPQSIMVHFGLCGSSLSLPAILVGLSPHPKIPFLADEAAKIRPVPTGASRALLLRIQTKSYELPTPFRWSIAQTLDVDASRQPTLDCSADELGSKKGERDRHVDMTDTASLAQRNLLSVSDGS